MVPVDQDGYLKMRVLVLPCGRVGHVEVCKYHSGLARSPVRYLRLGGLAGRKHLQSISSVTVGAYLEI